MRCDHAHDDGAYVLGALSPTERAEYERHLGSCPACREAVAEIAVLPGLLGRLDAATALQLLGPDEPADTADEGSRWPVMNSTSAGEARVTSLAAAAAQRRQRERRRRRARSAMTALAAACLALVVGLGIGVLRQDTTTGGVTPPEAGSGVHMEAMTEVAGTVPVTARIGLEGHSWGTEIIMECEYQGKRAWTYKLVAYGPDEDHEQIGSWLAVPGQPVRFNAATRFSGDSLVRLELTRADGNPLLAYDVP